MMHSSTKQKGFTLVETLVAISILMLAILGPLSIASAGLRNSLYAKDQITAFYLAQEGIEYVRYVRDETYLQDAGNSSDYGWLGSDLISKCLVDDLGDHGCVIDSYEWIIGNGDNDDIVKTCDTENADDEACPNRDLYVTEDGYYYTYDGSINQTPAKYKRVIKIEPVNDTTDEVKIVATMIWDTPSGKRTFELTENVFNVYQN
jgi:prepilin-type N-terminal cleavage/methylation domain-containing protein